jgi:hypothetical protein
VLLDSLVDDGVLFMLTGVPKLPLPFIEDEPPDEREEEDIIVLSFDPVELLSALLVEVFHPPL